MAPRIDRARVTRAFDSYVANYDMSNEKIRLKVVHTYKVAELCEQIAASLGLDSAERDVVWFCGMMHDIGRFEQVKRYGTFVDSISVNHAEFGADLLFKDGLISSFVDECDPRVETAIRMHNRLEVDPSVAGTTLVLCDIVRDADKVDILRVLTESPVEEVYNVTSDEIRGASITPEVEAVFYEKRCVPRQLHRTVMDRLVGHFCFAFELVYPESLAELRRQGHLQTLMSVETNNAETAAKLARMRAFMDEYLTSPAL